jgi:hypothetical protein
MKLPEVQLNQKTIITISAIILLIAIVYFVARKAIKAIKSDKDIKELDEEIKANALSYPLNQYLSMADTLDSSFTYITTDEDTIYSVFKKMNTLSDVLQLNKAFGLREFYGFWGEMSLAAYLQRGLSLNEKEEVNKILKTNNVNFSF